MRNSGQMREFAAILRESVVQEYLGNDKRALTDEEQAKIDEMLVQRLTKYFVNEKPPIPISHLQKTIAQHVPNVDLVPKQEQAKRAVLRTKAAAAYAKAQADGVRYISAIGDFNENRSKRTVFYCMNRDELRIYEDAYLMSQESYYKDKGLDKKQIEQKIAENTKMQWSVIGQTIKRSLDEYEDVLRKEYSDEELIEKYPELSLRMNMVVEACNRLIPELRKNQLEEFPEGTLERLTQRYEELMDQATMLSKRMSVLVDPAYPYIKFEKLWDAPPHQIDTLFEMMKSDIVQEKVGRRQVYVDSDIKTEEVIAQYEKPKKNGKNIIIDSYENVFFMMSEISFANSVHFSTILSEKMGMSLAEMKKNMVLVSQKGKAWDFAGSAMDYFLDDEKVLYIASKTGNDEPKPILWDQSKGKIAVLAGMKEIEAAENPNPVEPKKLGRWADFVNSMTQFFFKRPSAAMKRYEAELENYKKLKLYQELKKDVKEKGIPEAVKKGLNTARTNYKEEQFLKKFEKHLDELAKQEGYETVIKAAKKVIEKGDAISKKLLRSLSDEQLLACNNALKNDPKLDFGKLIKETIDNAKAAEKLELEKPEPETRLRSKTKLDLAKTTSYHNMNR